MSNPKFTLNQLKHSSFSQQYGLFLSAYKKLFAEEELSDEEIAKLLSIAILFTNQTDEIVQRLGYRIVLAYGNKTRDFTPLYDIALNSGLIPVAALLNQVIKNQKISNLTRDDSFLANMIDSYIDNFREEGIVFTEQQYLLGDFFNNNLGETAAIIAPTSYGKSELIISAISQSKDKRICILVPTKSLLAQTKKRVLDAGIAWVTRIVSHPEMHSQDYLSSIYIVTQERLTTILNQDKKMFFDMVIVDEAHNLLHKDSRNILLASIIRTLEFRNPNTAFKFLTPFLRKTASLRIRDSVSQPREFSVTEYVKSERLYIVDFRNDEPSLVFYDHFTNEFIPIQSKHGDYIAYLRNNSASKNIVYLNKPRDIQVFAAELANSLPEIQSDSIDEAIDEIGSNLDQRYLLLHCMKHGVLYHHGSMTDAMRNYSEHLYRNCKEIRFLISNSTLLEGVNLPIERMFLLSTMKGRGDLRPSQFKNLIGRVNRFSEIFSSDSFESLSKLQPEIHIIGTEKYGRAKANLHSFCEKVMRVTKKDEDEVENVLLEETKIDDKNEADYVSALTRLENIENGITNGFDCQIATTAVGLKLLESNITEIDVFKSEQMIEHVLTQFILFNGPISDSNTLIALIHEAFVSFIDPKKTKGEKGIVRLQDKKAQTFYAMFLDWGIAQAPLPVMIQRFIKYWEKQSADVPVYVGKWGDAILMDGHLPYYTYMKDKNISEKINLAIVRIKEEEDFVDFVIFRFIEILHELEILDEDFYKRIKYGTTDRRIIALIKNGFSRGVAELLLSKYREFIEFRQDDSVQISPSIQQQIKVDKVGFLQRHEISLNIVGAPDA